MNLLLNEQNSYDISNFLNTNCMGYSKYVLTHRAIPDVRDGLKPIHRFILWTFFLDNLLYNKPRAKSCNACGRVLAYSPHGDASVYQSAVRLANDSVMLQLIDGKGSFSSITSRDVQAGASRYTEMRLSELATDLLDGVKDDIVDMELNYDETKLQPKTLPSKFPLILCNPSKGLGVGFASNICSFNLSEVCNYTIATLNNQKPKPLAPDFPTYGNILYNEEVLKQIDDSGTGTVRLRAKYSIENNEIVITEIPYTTTREAIIEKIIELVKANKIKEITDINDFTGKDGLNITIETKKNTNHELLMNNLFRMTPLEDTFSCNFNVICEDGLRVLGVNQIVKEWIKYRKQCVTRGIKNNIKKAEIELNKLLGLKSLLDDLDTAIAIIRGSKTDKEAQDKLKNHFTLNDGQVEYITTIRMINMNKEWINRKVINIEEVKNTITDLSSKANDDEYIKQVIISQLQSISKKYGQPRKTEVIYDVPQAKAIKQIEQYNCYAVLSRSGYAKKTKRDNQETQKVKDGDEIILNCQTTNLANLHIITNKCNSYMIKMDNIDIVSSTAMGMYLPNILKFEDGEHIIFAFVTEDYVGNIVYGYSNGKVAKVQLSSYKTSYTKTAKAYNQNADLIFVALEEDRDMLALSSNGKLFAFDHSGINPKASKTAQGTQAQKLKEGQTTVMMKYVTNDFEDYEYYKGNLNGIGKFVRKGEEAYV